MQLYHDIDIHEDKHSIEEIITSRMVMYTDTINTFHYLYHIIRCDFFMMIYLSSYYIARNIQ